MKAAVGCALCLIVLAGCGGGGGGGGGQTPPPVAATGTVTGKVISAETGDGIANATVAAGGVSGSTDAGGNFFLANVPVAGRQTVSVNAAGFTGLVKVSDVVAGSGRSVRLRLSPVAVTQTVDPAIGATITVPNSSAQIVLPAGSLVKATGTAASGNVTVRVTPLNPALSSEILPGDYSTLNAGNPAALESFGALVVTLSDAQGDRVNLRSGSTAALRIPVGSRSSNLPPTVALLFLDEASARWRQEGTATLSADSKYYDAIVSHFSTWGTGQVFGTVQARGCVKDSQNRAVGAGVQVISDGIDYSGSATALTDSNGCYAVALKQDGLATLAARSGIKDSNTLAAGPRQIDFDVSADLVIAEIDQTITVKLTWGVDPHDLDSHLQLPDGREVSPITRGTLNADPFAQLDLDDTFSFGPEVVTVKKRMIGTYRYFVHNISHTFAPGMTGSPARVEVTADGITKVFQPPAGEGTLVDWLVFDLTVNADCSIAITARQLWLPAPPAASPGTLAYCS